MRTLYQTSLGLACVSLAIGLVLKVTGFAYPFGLSAISFERFTGVCLGFTVVFVLLSILQVLEKK